MAQTTQTNTGRRGVRSVLLALLAAALVMSPSYLATEMVSRLKLDVSIVAVISLAVFLIGVFLLVRLLRD